MKKQQESLVASLIITVFMATALFLPGLVSAGDLEPSAPPGPTMKTLDEIPPTWSQKFATANERFELVLDGQGVLDKETGLVWARDATTVAGSWHHAFVYCRSIAISDRKGWRLPSIEELASLLDMTQIFPALTSGIGFKFEFGGSFSFYVWSSTEHESNNDYAWVLHPLSGGVYERHKDSTGYRIWPVRGGQ